MIELAGCRPKPAATIVIGLALFAIAAQKSTPNRSLFGFDAESAKTQLVLERRFSDGVSARRIAAAHVHLTAEPHVAGSPRDRALADWVRDRWREYGLDAVDIVEHETLLSNAKDVTVELTTPHRWRASMKEEPVPGDPYSGDRTVGIPYHAYSASGEVEAPVVYANSGNPADYDWLAAQGIDIKGKIALVRYSVPYSYRGFKALTAQERGAAGILIYSDPADDGYAKGKVYPDGPWGPPSHIQRGAIVYDFLVPGDPLTPGWPSTRGARRIQTSEAVSLPKIMSAPLSYKDARVILEALGGRDAPSAWKGALPIPYRVGGGAATVRMRVQMDDRVRPIWTVVGRIRGAKHPDEAVIVGNHRDAWIFGGVDPSSGSAAMMELARGLGALARRGARPDRTIIFASWDAEEFTLTSSTEWGEENEAMLREGAVAYLNVDSAASGPHFTAAAVPALNRLILESADAVFDPRQGTSVAAAWRREKPDRSLNVLPNAPDKDLVNNRLGSGSDYTVFLNFVGVPIANLSFDGPYGVYHSIYDNHRWVSRIGDPGFAYHAALTRIWGIATLRLANAPRLPLDYVPYATQITAFVAELEKRIQASGMSNQYGILSIARDAAARLRAAAQGHAAASDAALAAGDTTTLDALNRALMAAERALLDPSGIPGRPWYRHQIYAPKFTYAPELLPGVAAALDARDARLLEEQVKKLAAALDRAARTLQQ
jgi:N-acetylated-alpha-linked acidic dipeptidase